MTSPNPPRPPRRLWKWLVASLAVVGLVVAALPWLLSSSLAQGPISQGINRAFAPGQVTFDSIELSWFRPTRLSQVRLIDPDGKTIADIPVVILDRNLGQILTFGPSSPITLDLDGTALEVERKADGSIDLVSALKTIISVHEPRRHVTIRIARGTLHYQDPVLLEAVTADSLDLNLQIPPAPRPDHLGRQAGPRRRRRARNPGGLRPLPVPRRLTRSRPSCGSACWARSGRSRPGPEGSNRPASSTVRSTSSASGADCEALGRCQAARAPRQGSGARRRHPDARPPRCRLGPGPRRRRLVDPPAGRDVERSARSRPRGRSPARGWASSGSRGNSTSPRSPANCRTPSGSATA